MSDFNRINPAIRFNTTLPSAKKPVEEGQSQAQPEVKADTPKTNFKSPDEVLNLLDQNSYKPALSTDKSTNTQKKTIKVSDHVTPEQAQRISQSVKTCINNLLTAEEEGVKMGLSQQAAQTLAVATVNNMMPQ